MHWEQLLLAFETTPLTSQAQRWHTESCNMVLFIVPSFVLDIVLFIVLFILLFIVTIIEVFVKTVVFLNAATMGSATYGV